MKYVVSSLWVSFNNYVDQIVDILHIKYLPFVDETNCGLSTEYLGTIQILRKHVFGLFYPTQPPTLYYLPLLVYVVIEWPSVPFVENDGYGYGK